MKRGDAERGEFHGAFAAAGFQHSHGPSLGFLRLLPRIALVSIRVYSWLILDSTPHLFPLPDRGGVENEGLRFCGGSKVRI